MKGRIYYSLDKPRACIEQAPFKIKCRRAQSKTFLIERRDGRVLWLCVAQRGTVSNGITYASFGDFSISNINWYLIHLTRSDAMYLLKKKARKLVRLEDPPTSCEAKAKLFENRWEEMLYDEDSWKVSGEESYGRQHWIEEE